MSAPSLTAIMSNYNHGHFIRRAIEAVVSQSRPPDEYLILDDASTDDSLEIMEQYASKYSFIRVLRNDRNLGAVHSLARLVKEASGDYLYGGAADDYVLPGFFKSAMDIAERHPQVGIIFGKFHAVSDQGETLGTYGIEGCSNPILFLPEHFHKQCIDLQEPSHSLCGATVYRRAALEEMGGFRRELGSWCDTFAARACALKYGAYYVPTPFSVWTALPNSFSATTHSNPRRNLDVIARATWLMRSPGFRDLFPTTGVSDWESRYRQVTIDNYAREMQRNVAKLTNAYDRSLGARSFSEKVFYRIWRTILHLATQRAVRRLQKYQGDVSCFDGNSLAPV